MAMPNRPEAKNATERAEFGPFLGTPAGSPRFFWALLPNRWGKNWATRIGSPSKEVDNRYRF